MSTSWYRCSCSGWQIYWLQW